MKTKGEKNTRIRAKTQASKLPQHFCSSTRSFYWRNTAIHRWCSCCLHHISTDRLHTDSTVIDTASYDWLISSHPPWQVDRVRSSGTNQNTTTTKLHSELDCFRLLALGPHKLIRRRPLFDGHTQIAAEHLMPFIGHLHASTTRTRGSAWWWIVGSMYVVSLNPCIINYITGATHKILSWIISMHVSLIITGAT